MRNIGLRPTALLLAPHGNVIEANVAATSVLHKRNRAHQTCCCCCCCRCCCIFGLLSIRTICKLSRRNDQTTSTRATIPYYVLLRGGAPICHMSLAQNSRKHRSGHIVLPTTSASHLVQKRDRGRTAFGFRFSFWPRNFFGTLRNIEYVLPNSEQTNRFVWANP